MGERIEDLKTHAIVRLAALGVPALILARGYLTPPAEIDRILLDALKSGHLLRMPPLHLSKEAPLGPDIDMVEVQLRADELSKIYTTTPAESRLLAALLVKKSLDLSTAHFVLSGDRETTAKIVAVTICKLRAKLRAHDIEINSMWGRGYYMVEHDKVRIATDLATCKGMPRLGTTLVPEVEHADA